MISKTDKRFYTSFSMPNCITGVFMHNNFEARSCKTGKFETKRGIATKTTR
jgi:hypothetical protein